MGVHEVKPGETLWGVSREYGVPMGAIRRLVAIDDPDVIHAGERLLIPDPDPVEPEPDPPADPPADPEPVPEPPAEPVPVPPPAPSGALFTPAELTRFRARASDGPYRIKGDVKAYSPGQWAAVKYSTNAVMSQSIGQQLWGGPAATLGSVIASGGCLRATSTGGGGATGGWMRPAYDLNAASLSALVTGDRAVASKVRDVVMSQVDHRDTKFTDRSRWCHDGSFEGHDGLGHVIAFWMSHVASAVFHLTAYERDTGRLLFEDADRARLHAWLIAGADWQRDRNERSWYKSFVDPLGGDWTLTAAGKSYPNGGTPQYDGGPRLPLFGVRFSNKWTNRARCYSLVGALTGDERLIVAARRFWLAFLKYGYLPDGAVSDGYRLYGERPAYPSRGWKYCASQVNAFAESAEIFARYGDLSLYELATSDGHDVTRGDHHLGGPKTLATAMADICKYIPGTPGFYGRTAKGVRIEPEDRVADMSFAPAARRLGSGLVMDAITRRTWRWPERPAVGNLGDDGITPAPLLMYAE